MFTSTAVVAVILFQRPERWVRFWPQLSAQCRALQCLPIRKSTLALIVYMTLVAPVIVTSLAATAVTRSCRNGDHIPLYMIPVFAIAPALRSRGSTWRRATPSQAPFSSGRRSCNSSPGRCGPARSCLSRSRG